MNKPLKIVLTGAESTGKSTLAESLAKHYGTIWIPELARGYIEKLGRKYTYSDVETIAQGQVRTEQHLKHDNGIVFFDTWLIITKVWFDFVYGKHPKWLDKTIEESNVGFFLLCNIDIPWSADPVRENGGENRKKLHEIYLRELKHWGFNFEIVNGMGEKRLLNAIKAVDKYLSDRNIDN